MSPPQKKASNNNTVLLSLTLIGLFFIGTIDARTQTIGINYGRVANNLPSPSESVALIKNLKIGRVKIYDSNPDVLRALSNSGLQVTIMVTNQEVTAIAQDQANADQWVEQNVVAWYPSTKITTVVVGNEILSDYSNQATWIKLVPAMQNIRNSLSKRKLQSKIRVTTSVAVDCLATSFPPSNGTFREDLIKMNVISPLLHFLSRSRSFFFINVYPYFAWASNPSQIPLEYALFASSQTVVSDGALHYTNMLDAQMDALLAAMNRLGYGNVKVAISETGWPTHGDESQPGANMLNAAQYNRRLVRRVLGKASDITGTPLRPSRDIPTFIFSLFNENQKPGPSTERNWGLLYPNGSAVYDIDLTGHLKDNQYTTHINPAALPVALNPTAFSNPQQSSGAGQQWCVANPNVQIATIQKGLDYACSKADCSAIQPGKPCYQPNSVVGHASYAFNIYWQTAKHSYGTCDFGGAAVLTTSNPSYGSCYYPSN